MQPAIHGRQEAGYRWEQLPALSGLKPMKVLLPNLEHQNGDGEKEDVGDGFAGKDPPEIVVQYKRSVIKEKGSDQEEIK